VSFSYIEGGLLKGYKDIRILTVLGEINAHALEAISSEERDQRGVLLFHDIRDVFKGFAHGVLDHLLLGLLHLLEPLIEVGKHLRKEGRVRLVE
jgi:hypothetical protein